MKKNLPKFMVMMALLAFVCLPGIADADYVQSWTENGLYGSPAEYQTWDTAEVFLLTPGISWAGAGLTISSGTGWVVTLVNPQYALATGSEYDVQVSGNFNFTTRTTAGPFSFDWVLSKSGTGAIVGVYNLAWTASTGWNGTELDPVNPPVENRSPIPLPPTMLLLGSGLVGLILLRGGQRTQA